MKEITIDIVCPVYEGYDDIVSLYQSFSSQKNVKINKVVCPLTIGEKESTGKIIKFFKDNNITYFLVEKKDFSHSLTRQKAIFEYCESRCIVMMSQDVKLIDENAFYNIVKSIDAKETVYNYGRQICVNHSIERYVRRKNYPKKSNVTSLEDAKKIGIMAFFGSDAFSAYDRDVFIRIGGYRDHVMMSEDMLYCYNALNAGYKRGYVEDAVVNHSHKYTLKQLYHRYIGNGKFFSDVPYFKEYKVSGGGAKLAIYVFFQALIHFNIPVLFRWLPDMSVRYFGLRKGRKMGQK